MARPAIHERRVHVPALRRSSRSSPATTGVQPVEAILFAQAANGILLPSIALFLLLAVNDGRWMGEHRNGVVANVVGGVIFLVTVVLGGRALLIGLGVL